MFVHDRLFCVFCIFFFKQKTAYEMRISDWSSDVCSSDLRRCPEAVEPEVWRGRLAGLGIDIGPAFAGIRRLWRGDDEALAEVRLPDGMTSGAASMHQALLDACLQVAGGRSEEHTSDLQSLMRITYAVLCLKKKKNNKSTHNSTAYLGI